MPGIRLRCGHRGREAFLRRARGRERGLRASPLPSSAERAGAAGRRRDEGRPPVLQLREGAGRDPGRVRRRRLARAARRGRLAELARDRRPAPGRDPDRARRRARSTGSRSTASSSRARTAATGWRAAAARPASGCCRSATAPGTRSRPALRDAFARLVRRSAARTARSSRSSRRENGWVANCKRKNGEELVIDAGAVVLAAGGRCYREAEERGRAVDQPSRRDRRGDADRGRARRREPRPRTRSSTTRMAAPGRRRCRATRSPRPRARTARPCSTRPARSSPTRSGRADAVSRAIFDEVDSGRGVETPDGRPAVLPRHHADSRGRRGDLAPVHAAPLPFRRDRPAPRGDPDLSGAPLPERRPRDRRARRDDPARPLRLRRDRRRHPWAEPDDGQLAARVHRFRPARGRCGSERVAA